MFKIFTDKRQIEYLDVDKNNKLTTKAIINMMQDTAGGHSESIGDGLNNKAKTGTAWILLNWKLEVFRRPKYKEFLSINTWARKMEKCFSYREFEVFCNDELVAKAESKWVLISSVTGKITRIPEELMEKYNPEERKVFDIDFEEKLYEPKDLKLVYETMVGRTQIDTNNHLNNIYYLDFAIESLPEEVYENKELNHVEIMYKKASRYKEILKCYYGKEEDKNIVVIKDTEGNIHAIVKMW